MHCETASTSLTGDRSENQDRCAILEDGDTLLLLLADGMGGHARGELAAACFIETLSIETRLMLGDVLLLCSDGLWSAVSEARLTELVRTTSLQDCVERLASEAAANSAPGSDNVTLVALRSCEV